MGFQMRTPHESNDSATVIPDISSMAVAERINGMLRIDAEIYYVINGLLYKFDSESDEESHDPVGALGPGYIYQFAGREVESLADQNRVLMRFHIKGSEQEFEHMLLAFSGVKGKSGHMLSGGLLNARDLAIGSKEKAAALEGARKESKEKRNWFDNLISATLTSGMDRDAAAKIDRGNKLAVKNAQKIHELFSIGFDSEEVHAEEFDKKCNEILHLWQSTELHAISSADLLKKHEICNVLIREGIITSAAIAASAAATAATEGLAAPAFIANLAHGTKLFHMGRTLMSSASAVGSLNTVVRYKKQENGKATMQQNIRNYLDGCLQGAAMNIPVAPIGQLSQLVNVDHVARFLGKSTLSYAGRNIREKGQVLPDGNSKAGMELATATAMSLITQGMGLQISKMPVFADVIKSALDQLEICNRMREQGGDSGVILKLEQEALLKIKVVEYMVHTTKSTAITVGFSTVPALPEAVERERMRIAKKLGKKTISNEELLKHIDFKNVIAYAASENLSLCAVQSTVMAQISTTKVGIKIALRKAKKAVRLPSSAKRPSKSEK